MMTQRSTLIVAHRGASYDAPENTLAAFRLAWEQQADGIEGDFRLTRDGHVVCIHDATTTRTAGFELEVANSTLAELRQLDVGLWKDGRYVGERIPTLEEVISILPNGKRIVIELKTGPEIVEPMANLLKASNLQPEQVLVISFDQQTIVESKRVLPSIKTHWLTTYDPPDEIGPWTPSAESIAQTVSRIGADGLGSQARRHVLQHEFVRALNDAGVTEFHVWTVDDADDARHYQALGAYGINTNRPALIRRELDK